MVQAASSGFNTGLKHTKYMYVDDTQTHSKGNLTQRTNTLFARIVCDGHVTTSTESKATQPDGRVTISVAKFYKFGSNVFVSMRTTHFVYLPLIGPSERDRNTLRRFSH